MEPLLNDNSANFLQAEDNSGFSTPTTNGRTKSTASWLETWNKKEKLKLDQNQTSFDNKIIKS